MSEKSRYIPKIESDSVKRSSGFRCAWDGEYLFDRNHIYEFKNGGKHSSGNLILLCPNCHRKYHKGEISKKQLQARRRELSGCVNRSSGNLSINSDLIVKIGKTEFSNVKEILRYNDLTILKTEIENGYLLISLMLFNKDGSLICWMSKNRWWVENESDFEFNFSKEEFKVWGTQNDIQLTITISKSNVLILGKLYIGGNELIIDGAGHQFSGNNNKGRVNINAGKISGFECCYFITDKKVRSNPKAAVYLS